MRGIKISSKVELATWNELKALATRTHRNVPDLPTEVIREYVARKRACPEVLKYLDQSIADNNEALPFRRIADVCS